MKHVEQRKTYAGKIVVIGLVSCTVAMFVLFLPTEATERVLSRLDKLIPLFVIANTIGIAYLIARTHRKR